MTVQETLNALGQWEIDLLPTIPREKLDALQFFGHIAIVHGRVDPLVYGDSLLNPGVARYVGVLRTNSLADDARTKIPNDNVKIGGVGMAMWLGDQDNKGAVIENATTFASGSTFPNVIRGLLPSSGAVTEGTLYSVTGTYSGTHQWQSPLQAVQYVCDTMSTPTVPVGWRVNNNATLDAGPESNLYVTTPQATIVARGDGQDMAMLGIPGSMDLTADVEDFTTRVVLLAQGDGASIATGTADLAPGSNPYKDLHGNAVKLTRLVSESDTTAPNAPARAAIALDQYTAPKQDLRLSIQDYDVEGTFNVGDYIYAYDPDKDLVDPTVEIVFRGQRLNPIKLQVTEVQWPVTADYTVAYRAADGTWTDITDHIQINAAGTYVTVGGFARPLVGGGQPVGSRPNADTSIPGVPVLVTPFTGTAYLDSRGFTRSRVIVSWNAPLNVDGSSILDGDHYEVRYAVDTDMIYPATWAQVSQIRWQDMQTWAQPFASPDGDWQVAYVPWSATTVQLQDLSPGVGYDIQIRAVDATGNAGAWSATTTFVATSDNIPPSTPAAASVAASRIAVQVTHTLGKSSGGTFNLESDLDHLEIHGQYEPTFTPSSSTLLGKLKANSGMIQAGIPAVATYNIESTAAVYVKCVAVDISGNRSGVSDPASSTALLIDDAHISDLTVSKVTAGTITASWVMAGEIKTADVGARMRISSTGFELYDASGTQTMLGSATDGSLSMVGQLASGVSGKRLVVNPSGSASPELRFYPTSGSNYSFINAFDNTLTSTTAAGIQMTTSTDGSNIVSTVAMDENLATFGRYKWDATDIIYYSTGGFSQADNNGVRTAYFSGKGGSFGGSFLGTATEAEVGWFGTNTSKWNSIQFGSDGWARVFGKFEAESWAYGSVNISPVANTPTSVTVTGLALPGDNFYAFTQAQTTVPGTAVLGTGTSGVSSSGLTVWLTRTNTSTTNIHYSIIGWL